MSLDVPVLLLAWRRPETTREVVSAIRAAAPRRLFVACDGPRPGRADDAEAVRECRAQIDASIDWPCTVERLYRESNLGCRRGVSEAIDWFFGRVDEGIVLEDDCVPHPDFFAYSAELLARYRDDERVWCISGDNFQDGRWRGDGSYYFSQYTHVWGWASWRRAWQHYDASLARWPSFRDSGLLHAVFPDPVEAGYWTEILDRLCVEGIPDTWDYQWFFACVASGGLTILPNRNLVRNIGFGAGATNTTSAAHLPPQSTGALVPLKHPGFVVRDRAADAYSFDGHFGGKALRETPTRVQRMRRLVRRWLRTMADRAGLR